MFSHICVYVCIYVCVYVYMYTYRCARKHIDVYVRILMWMYAYVDIFVPSVKKVSTRVNEHYVIDNN